MSKLKIKVEIERYRGLLQYELENHIRALAVGSPAAATRSFEDAARHAAIYTALLAIKREDEDSR